MHGADGVECRRGTKDCPASRTAVAKALPGSGGGTQGARGSNALLVVGVGILDDAVVYSDQVLVTANCKGHHQTRVDASALALAAAADAYGVRCANVRWRSARVVDSLALACVARSLTFCRQQRLGSRARAHIWYVDCVGESGRGRKRASVGGVGRDVERASKRSKWARPWILCGRLERVSRFVVGGACPTCFRSSSSALARISLALSLSRCPFSPTRCGRHGTSESLWAVSSTCVAAALSVLLLCFSAVAVATLATADSTCLLLVHCDRRAPSYLSSFPAARRVRVCFRHIRTRERNRLFGLPSTRVE